MRTKTEACLICETQPHRSRWSTAAALAAISMSCIMAAASPTPASAETEPPTQRLCTAEQLGEAVDVAGDRLRSFNEEATPGLQARLRQLATAKGWGAAATEQRAMDYLLDAKLAAFDKRAGDLLARIDTLSRNEAGATVTCSTISDLEAASIELLAVMKAKLAYLQDKIMSETAGGSTTTASRDPFGEAGTSSPRKDPFLEGSSKTPTTEAPAAAEPKVEPKISAATPPATQPKPDVPKRAQTKTEQAAAAAKPKSAVPDTASQPPKKTQQAAAPTAPPARAPEVSAWNTTTERSLEESLQPGDVAQLEPQYETGPAAPGAPDGGQPVEMRQGYTIDEIQSATRGFFGTISTGLGSVIEHAFATWGRPTAYILGEEGGGAFLAGLRYGKGTLYPRLGEAQTIYWHGPSLGYDFGAAGSRTLILVYRATNPADLYRSFTGLDGSAYLVGGVGLTLMTSGSVHIAPIRSGLGLRLGANIGYIRFAPQPTWNPF